MATSNRNFELKNKLSFIEFNCICLNNLKSVKSRIVFF